MTNLKGNIWIEGVNTDDELFTKLVHIFYPDKLSTIIYEGKTSEIPEDVAMECVEVVGLIDGNLYLDYNYPTGTIKKYIWDNARESILSACPEEYCIIYRK